MTEPVRLAAFLRERCARNKYGLRYLNAEQTLIYIPWPVVPRPNEEPPPGFQMFHEWAELSHRRRGNNEAAELRESATQQKHRFRNALARANGITYRKDVVYDGARVYELVDSHRQVTNSEVLSPISQNCADDYLDDTNDFIINAFSPNYTMSPQGTFPDFTSPPQQPPAEYGDPNYYPGQYTPAGDPVIQGSSSSNQGALNIDPYSGIMQNGHEDADLVELREILSENSSQAPGEPQVSATPMSVNESAGVLSQECSYAAPSRTPPVEGPPELVIQVRFRQEDASTFHVTNKSGCRVYFGRNILNLPQLLEKEHLDNLLRRFRYPTNYYYGPESLQQIQLPSPKPYMRSPVQENKTSAVLLNMDRGLLLCLEYLNDLEQINIPNVYALRLCQTRIFPCRSGGGQLKRNPSENDSLKRMEWTMVFNGVQFCEQLQTAAQQPNASENYPSPSFSFSIGQRPPNEERSFLLVCLTVTVQRAQQLIQSHFDAANGGGDICISHITSTDLEARDLAEELQQTLTL